MSHAFPLPPAGADPGSPGLRLVPDLPRPLGEGVLPEESPLDQEVVCRRLVQETPDVVTLVLEPTLRGGVAFAPGQYLTLRASIDGREVERCYTISSPPTRPHLVTLTVKRVPDGEMSAYLHERLRPGDRLTVAGPLGGFCVAEHPARRYLLLSAGSGVTPTLATLRTMADLAEPADVVVVHSARTPDDLVCRPEVEALAATVPGLRVHWICEDDGSVPWTGPRGRLSSDLLQALVPDVADREVFTCGPPGYMAAVREVLVAVGADPARCHEESFVLGTAGAPSTPAAPPEARGETASDVPADLAGPTVRFERSGCAVVCGPGTTVLSAAVQAGVRLPSSCAEGLCGTCKSTLLAGRVDMAHQGGIRPREVAQDKFLPCCSTPDGDIVVDR